MRCIPLARQNEKAPQADAHRALTQYSTRGRNRTGTDQCPMVFETIASTNSATRADTVHRNKEQKSLLGGQK